MNIEELKKQTENNLYFAREELRDEESMDNIHPIKKENIMDTIDYYESIIRILNE